MSVNPFALQSVQPISVIRSKYMPYVAKVLITFNAFSIYYKLNICVINVLAILPGSALTQP